MVETADAVLYKSEMIDENRMKKKRFKNNRILLLLCISACAVLVCGCNDENNISDVTPSPNLTVTMTVTPTSKPGVTSTVTPTVTPSLTEAPIVTPTEIPVVRTAGCACKTEEPSPCPRSTWI